MGCESVFIEWPFHLKYGGRLHRLIHTLAYSFAWVSRTPPLPDKRKADINAAVKHYRPDLPSVA